MTFLQKVARKLKWEWQNRNSFVFRINQKWHHFLIKHSKNPNPSSYPYISGDTFRSISDHVLDESSQIDGGKVRSGDIIFVKITYINEFFTSIHPAILNPYILITHNGDDEVGIELAKKLDGKIIRWYAQNVTVENPKIIPLPIGLENIDYYNNGVPAWIKKAQKMETPKKDKIIFGFTIGTNPAERLAAFNALSTNPLAEKIQNWPTAKDYFKKIAGYKFIASPPGNGIDCIRTWEALHLKIVPIVKRSPVTEYFYDLGLPLFIVDSWKELDSLTEKSLREKYQELRPKFESPALHFDYWLNKIKND